MKQPRGPNTRTQINTQEQLKIKVENKRRANRLKYEYKQKVSDNMILLPFTVK